MEGQIGAVRAGYLADLIVVNGNPLENMKVLYPSEGAGVEWTIKDGIPYHAPTLAGESASWYEKPGDRTPRRKSPPDRERSKSRGSRCRLQQRRLLGPKRGIPAAEHLVQLPVQDPRPRLQ
jgi:hypothetical protein